MTQNGLEKGTIGSSLALGCMRMAALSAREAEEIVLQAMESGIILFDHADIYGGGQSERIFGELLKRHPGLREKLIIQDKCGICSGYYDASKEHIIKAVEGSLTRLGIDTLDMLLLHRPDALMEPQEIAEAFLRLQREGKVRRFGVSNMNGAQIELLKQAMPAQLIAVNQLQFGLGHATLVDEGIFVNTDLPQGVLRTGSVIDFHKSV